MRYSLINVESETNGFVNGVWLQDCNGVDLSKAIERARATMQVNSNSITVAVVEALGYVPDYSMKYGLKRLG